MEKFTIESVTDARYSSANNKQIDCLVKFSGFSASIPFTAQQNDPLPHVKAVFAEAKKGTVAPYEPPAA